MMPNDDNRDPELGVFLPGIGLDAEDVATMKEVNICLTELDDEEQQEPADVRLRPSPANKILATLLFLCLLCLLYFVQLEAVHEFAPALIAQDVVGGRSAAGAVCKFPVGNETTIYPDNEYKPDEHPYVDKCKNANHQLVMALTDWDTGVISINHDVGSSVDLNRTICKVLQEEHIDVDGNFHTDDPNWVSWYPKQHTVQIEKETALVWCSMCLTNETKCDPSVDRAHQYWDPARWIPVIDPTTPSAVAVERYNIHMIVLESSSDALVRRRMKRTYDALLNKLNFTHFKWHSRVGENTHPNLLATLSGRLATRQDGKEDLASDGVYWDDQPFLWNDLRQLGYVTHLGEDRPGTGAFKYCLKGFRKKPTDLFGNKYLAMYEKKPIVSARGEKGDMAGAANYCLNGRTSTHYLLDYAEKLHQKYAKAQNKPYWSMTYIGYGHEGANPSHMDAYFAEVLKRMVGAEAEKTMFVVMGDHGMRYGKGKIYAGQPFLAVKLPGALVKKYPKSQEWLAANANKFTTQLDIYELIQDIARSDFHEYLFGKHANQHISYYYGHGWGTSLVRSNLNPNRTCADVGINIAYCPCVDESVELINSSSATLPTHQLVDGAGAALVTWANEAVKTSDGKCLTMSLNKVTSLKRISKPPGSEPTYKATIIVDPSGGKISAYLEQKKKGKKEFEYIIKGPPERLGRWGPQNNCWREHPGMKDNEAFCYCKGTPHATAINP